jgi:two-component system phosphate regulon sensor histidine kinase PhoR
MEWTEIDLYELAAKAIAGLEAEAKTAEVKTSLHGEYCCLHGIPQLLHSILYNLCDNAIKYNRNGGEVKVSVEGQGDSVLLTVSDTGIGIPAQEQERIFERFYRVDKSRSKEVGGTGLGLSIVKHAVLIHHGAIEVDSAVGEGTTITVRLPI